MYIKTIRLQNYRNYKQCNITLGSKLNVFVGDNAQGKTNLLESIFFASIGKSPRTNKEKDVLLWGEKQANIDIEVIKKFNKTKITMFVLRNDKKTIKINNIPIRKIGDLMGELVVVYFSPDEIKLVKEAPNDRRRFMDIDISQMDKNYFYLLLRYEKILNQRNKLLKETQNYEILKRTISIWNEQLSKIASKIIMKRLNFINKLNEYASSVHKQITFNKENISLSYQGIYCESEEQTEQKILTELSNNLEKDFNLKYTTIGPHRDDIKITINDIDIRNFGSQGQQRLTTLTIKLAELRLFKEEIGESPILLLDDVLSELDENRQKQFLLQIKDIQTILTCTNFPYPLENQDKRFLIKNGSIIV